MSLFFFFNDTATTEIYTLSLHDALPIFAHPEPADVHRLPGRVVEPAEHQALVLGDRKSTRLNSSHGYISYAVFCLKKKTEDTRTLDGLSYRSTIPAACAPTSASPPVP